MRTIPTRHTRLYHKENDCELWAPAMFANVVSYVRRCASDSDRIVYHIEGSQPIVLPSADGGPDRFAHFTQSGELVYSHLDTSRNTASLWMYVPGTAPFPLYSETTSDDDAYAERDGNEYIAFSGWGSSGYDLFVYSRTQMSAVHDSPLK